MKTQTLTILLALLATTLLLANCKGEPSCPDAEVSTRLMYEEYIKMLPYYGNDTFNFINNTGDTVIAIGSNKLVFFTSELQRTPNPECNVYHKVNYEAFSIDYGLFKIQRELQTDNCIVWYNDIKFEFDAWDIGALGPSIFHDSLFIGNNTYYRVNQFFTSDSTNSIFVNRQFGILKIVNNNKTLTKLYTL